MISVKNQFAGDNLEIEFSGEPIDTRKITVPILNDVNFKPVIDYLIQVIPKNTELQSSFEDFSEEVNVEKLGLIKETIEEIYEQFNLSLENLEVQVKDEDQIKKLEENEPEDDDLPF
ncbi:hypothetical protein [Cyclobacterium amurskyense]|uniref:Uncharacterized protein n=1 Tax=Cyclobacterium amurskyense TaxID=320787 RepID=A0A0H4PRL4_9BACT|nr:hypothetical protein [Cyclobacterium amurskyense]AKP50917.1 hypothetical protein CA2015_1479 [Cyclobacterium amurskyense]